MATSWSERQAPSLRVFFCFFFLLQMVFMFFGFFKFWLGVFPGGSDFLKVFHVFLRFSLFVHVFSSVFLNGD